MRISFNNTIALILGVALITSCGNPHNFSQETTNRLLLMNKDVGLC